MAGQQKVGIRIHYPGGSRIVLRTDSDWNCDIAPTAVSANGTCSEFVVPTSSPFLYFKPVRRERDSESWSVGHNYLATSTASEPLDVYPIFAVDAHCSACDLRELVDERNGRRHAYRVFYPPGYDENTLQRYPVLYMQDGQNLFFPGEAFQGEHWRVAETLTTLDGMNAIRPVIVVGIYPSDRQVDYTRPGYRDYGRFVVERLKPAIDAEFRTLPGPESTAVMGSSLGGVVSFHLAWQYPEVFGMAACMSSTFGWRDNLAERVSTEPRRPCRIYLDSGWPADNFEVTRNMRDLLRRRGFREGGDLHYFAFPEALHNERHWAMRAHLPFQLFFGERQALPAAAPRAPAAEAGAVSPPERASAGG